jgi:hypothetical protein
MRINYLLKLSKYYYEIKQYDESLDFICKCSNLYTEIN